MSISFFHRVNERILRWPRAGKFARDVSWNYLSLAVLGASGILLNVGVARYYGPAALGVFNLVFTTYLILSQVAVMGVHLSTQRHVAQYHDDQGKLGAIIPSGLAVTVTAAALVCGAVYLARSLFGRLFHSPDVAVGLTYVLPGLFCFAVNKVLLSVVNGFRRMRAYAVFQALRYLLLLAFLAVEIGAGMPAAAIPAIFSGAEICLLVCLLAYTRNLYTSIPASRWGEWPRLHAAFGGKALLGGILIDANTKIDILMLGYFCSDRIVGIYSLAAMLIEGFVQLAVVVRVNINPILARLAGGGLYDDLKKTVSRVVRIFYLFMVSVGVCAIIAYPLFIKLLVGRPGFEQSWPVFAILMTALMISAGYRPFDMLLVQAGRPALHTCFIGCTAISNIILNAVLIPVAGMYGAAVATGVAFILMMLFLKQLTRRSLGIRI